MWNLVFSKSEHPHVLHLSVDNNLCFKQLFPLSPKFSSWPSSLYIITEISSTSSICKRGNNPQTTGLGFPSEALVCLIRSSPPFSLHPPALQSQHVQNQTLIFSYALPLKPTLFHTFPSWWVFASKMSLKFSFHSIPIDTDLVQRERHFTSSLDYLTTC